MSLRSAHGHSLGAVLQKMQAMRARPPQKLPRSCHLAPQMQRRRAAIAARAVPVMTVCEIGPFWQEFCVNMAATYVLATSLAGTIQLARAISEDEHDNDEDSPL